MKVSGGLVGEVSADGTLISSSESNGPVEHDDSKTGNNYRGKDVGGLVGKLVSGGDDPSFVRIYQSKCIGGSIYGNYGVGGIIGRVKSSKVYLSREKLHNMQY